MAWGDDPVGDAIAATIATGNVGTPGWAVVPYQAGGSVVYNPALGYYVNAGSSGGGSGAPAAAAATPAHLQFSINTIGTSIFLALGRVRLPGQIIWAPGIDATNDVLTTSLLTFAAAYCEPINPLESVTIKSMSANGTVFYENGGVITVANITASAQTQLAACIANMAVYHGTETQLPDPTMESYLGAGNVPAYRGLRYIVFTDFPLEISNNSVPNIIVEWGPAALINVSDSMVSLIERVNFRSQYLQASTDTRLGTPTVTGIDDLCSGLTITTQNTLIDHFVNHAPLYNYHIKETDPISIVRRPVDSSLVIDYQFNEADLITNGTNPALVTARANPSSFPVGINLSYSDPDNNFDTKVSPAIFDGSQPGRSVCASSAIVSAQMDYIVDASTSRSLAYAALFNQRSYAGQATLEVNDVSIEIGDTIEVTTSTGDLYVLLAATQTITKNRSNQITALQLLTQGGTGINSDGGNDGGSISRKKWPQDVMLADFLVTPTFFYTGYEFDQIVSVNSNPSPLLIIGPSKWRDLDHQDPDGLNFGADSDMFLTNCFQDDTYVYWLAFGFTCFGRLPKDQSTINNEFEVWTIPAGMADLTDVNLNHWGNYGFSFKNGKLYLPWGGGFNGSAFSNSNDIYLLTIDMSKWGDQTSAAWTLQSVYTFSSGDITYAPMGVVALANGLLVMPATETFGILTGTRFYISSDGGATWSIQNSTFTFDETETILYSGNVIYSPENGLGTGIAHTKHRLAIWDFSSGFSETIVDLTDDPNIVCISQERGWSCVSDTHLYIACNHINYVSSDMPTSAPGRYLARRKLSDGSADGGRFYGEIIWNGFDFAIFRTRFFDGKIYIHWDCFDRTSTRLTEISEDLDPATITHWWPQQAPRTTNDNFAGAITTVINQIYTVDFRYGTTEVGEDYPPWARPTTGSGFNDAHTYHNGHSQWFKFVAPSTGNFGIAVDSTLSGVAGIAQIGFLYGIVVWTGSVLGSLTDIAHYTPVQGGSGPGTLTFAATSGTTYYISLYAYAGWETGSGTQNFTFDEQGAAFDLDTGFFGRAGMFIEPVT